MEFEFTDFMRGLHAQANEFRNRHKGNQKLQASFNIHATADLFFSPSMIFRVILPQLRLKKQQIYIFKYFFFLKKHHHCSILVEFNFANQSLIHNSKIFEHLKCIRRAVDHF